MFKCDQFFGGRVADAMEHLKRLGVKEFQDAGPTIAFIRRVNSLVEALNSRTPMTALRNDPDTVHYKVLKKMLQLFLVIFKIN